MKITIIVLLVFVLLLQLPKIVKGCELQTSEDQKVTRAHNCLKNDENSLNIEGSFPETTSLNFRPNASTVKTLPSSIFENFPNLESLIANAVGVEELPQGTFHEAKHLKTLSLERNRLESLLSGAFQGARALEVLKLGKNNMSLIEENAFNGLESLKKLDLSRNDLKNLLSNTFKSLKNLEMIDLSYNYLESLPNKDLFRESSHLKSIKLFKNRLTTFDIQLPSDQHFCYLNVDNNSINYFSLTFTQLIESTAADDNGCTSHGIHASHNEIEHFYVAKESMAVNLIAVDGNHLTDVRNISQVRALTKVDFSNNDLSPEALFELKNAKNLQALSLKGLNLTQLDPHIFSQLNKLTELDVSNNKLTEIDFTVFADGLQDFYKMNLANNCITTLDISKLLEKFPHITFLNIKGNQLTRNHLKSILVALKSVTVIQ